MSFKKIRKSASYSKGKIPKINGYLISPLLGFILSFFVDILESNNE